jgi:glutamate/tyrosine decarboxylase-like PLP-dependent enzyme
MWIYRNYFKKREAANVNDIAVIYSEDAHYSMPKGADLLGLSSIVVPVDQSTREISYELLNEKLDEHISKGFKYFIVILSMGTTMFGSVDNIDKVCHVFNGKEVEYKVHIDAAFGGFIYPFSNSKSNICFLHPHVSSIVVDGHKMLQAPYGTGMFLIRKGYIHYVCTMEAQYLPGMDFTLCGSRSGANAVATWMILNMWGSAGWKAKIAELIKRTDRLCKELSQIDIPYYRNKFMNIVALRSVGVGRKIAEKYNLVANTYDKKEDWWKLVVMPHVDDKVLSEFVIDIKNQHKNY